jgi:hypothetical protein
MRSEKRWLITLGVVTLTAWGAMAGPATAQKISLLPWSSNPGFFTVQGSKALAQGAAISGSQEGSGKLLVQGRGIDIECATAHIEEGWLAFPTEAFAKVSHLGCVVFEHNTENAIENCKLKSGGTIVSKVRIVPILHEGQNYIVITPAEGANFSTVSFEAGKGCVLPLNNPVTGTASASVSSLEAVTQLVSLSQAIQLLLWYELRFGSFLASPIGSATVELRGFHLGSALGVH